MDARELRLGNFFNRNGETYQVTGYDSYGVSHIIKSCVKAESTCILKSIEPIQLTKDWIIKFGFEKIRNKPGTQGVYSNGKFNVFLSNSGNVYTSRGKLMPYVHTLQNVYYFTLLTGEELTIKQ